MSDTPRMKAAQMAAMEHMTGDVYRVGCDLEIELNTANDRIKLLEDLGKELRECANLIGNYQSNEMETIDRAEAAVEAWDKEAK